MYSRFSKIERLHTCDCAKLSTFNTNTIPALIYIISYRHLVHVYSSHINATLKLNVR